jgi:hypothetical protein
MSPKAMKVMKAVTPKAKAKAKAKPQSTAIINEQGLPEASTPANEFSVFVQGQNEKGRWTLCKCRDLDAQSFIFKYLQQDLGMSLHSAAGFVGDLYLATIGGKILRKGDKICEVVEHMGHIQVCRRGRGGMSNAMCGLGKLSKANISEVLMLLDIDANNYTFDNKDRMVSYLYDKIANLAKKNEKLKAKVEDLEREIQNMQDIYITFMEVLI